jgi:hypothetical protein
VSQVQNRVESISFDWREVWRGVELALPNLYHPASFAAAGASLKAE